MRILREACITLLIAIAIFIPLRCTVQAYEVQYSCMLPNIEEGDWIMVVKTSYLLSSPERGDIIVFDPGDNVGSAHPFIKRIVGLPGETLEMRDGQVFIDGTLIAEPYILPEPPQRNEDFGPVTLGANEYFVLGDNRNNANDSRSWGPAIRENIIGKACFVYLPLHRAGVIRHYDYS